MTKKQLEEYFNLLTCIRSESESILVSYMKIRETITGEVPNQYLSFKKADDEYIYYSGWEYWRYGGEEQHTLELPISYLTDDNWVQTVAESFQKAVDIANIVDKIKKEKEIEAKRAQLESLKKEFGE